MHGHGMVRAARERELNLAFNFLSINFCINERLYFKIHVKIGSKNGNFHTLLVPLKMRALARSTDEVPSY